jgi:hypothetical protein
MSTTTSLDHPSSRVAFTEDHGVDPGWGGLVFGMVGLLLVVLGDFASFNIALSRSFSTMGPVMVLLLTLAMTAAAVLLMYEAGRAEARRRARNAGRTGRAPVTARIFAWLLLGLTAFSLRMAAPPEKASEGSGFGTASAGSSSGGFGLVGAEGASGGGFGATAEAASAPIVLGPMTWHPENFTSALALLAIFVAGGVGAFFLGKESYNPLLTEVRRARVARWRARRRLARAQARYDKAQARADQRTAAWEQHERATRELEVVSDLEHRLDLYEARVASLAAHQSTVRSLDAGISSAEAELASLPAEARLAQRQAQHAGTKAKELARVQIAQYRGEPAATSGLTNGVQR